MPPTRNPISRPMKKKSPQSDGKAIPRAGHVPHQPTKVYMGNLALSIDENAIKEASRTAATC